MSFKATSISYEDVSKLGDLIVDVYNQFDIPLAPQSEMMRYIKSAKLLFSEWQADDKNITNNSRKFFGIMEGCLECLRIGSAMQWVKNKPNLQLHLKKMLKGFIDPTEKERTDAKDFWFEINVAARLESAGIRAELVDPPDIEFVLDSSKYVIACKCTYSESNLEEQIRRARKQILRTSEKGIIAICIDALIDHSDLVIAPTQSVLYSRIMDKTERFLKQYERFLPDWINSRKVIGLLIFASTLSIIEDENTPREGQFVLINNRCSPNSPYMQVMKNLAGLLENAKF
ncbi:MAG TPA: hypothetical protein VF369_00770 [candidate division Zixibacteria bacterium]